MKALRIKRQPNVRNPTPLWRELNSNRPGTSSKFPLLCSAAQHAQNVVDCGPLGGVLLPTTYRHFPQFFGVAAGDGEI